ncbi:hypothetical protein [Mesorhizobium sp. M7A.F.Ca.MR.362.00.0.0]|jgi:hypothetical protein|nr:hypothetical protein [Mesorhizobium sp. M7A.F.Ca.MR.362.00.0.0]
MAGKARVGKLFAGSSQYAALTFFHSGQIGLLVALIGTPCVSL